MSSLYNRYIPQPDGSYRRRSVPEQMSRPSHPIPPPEPPRQESHPEPEPCENQTSTQSCSRCPHRQSSQRPPQRSRREPVQESPFGVGSFLKNLLPGNFDTEDLLVVVLLLLMSGDCQEDRNIPLLTLALYLFL